MLACLCQERSCGNPPRFWALEISRTVETAFIYMGLIQYDHQEWCHSSFNWRPVKQTTGSATVTSSIGASGQSCFLAVWKQLCQRNQHCPVLQFLFRTLLSSPWREALPLSLGWYKSKVSSSKLGAKWQTSKLFSQNRRLHSALQEIELFSEKEAGEKKTPNIYHRMQHLSSHNTVGKVPDL